MLVFLGDYIDRGDNSRGVVDLLITLQQRSGLEVHCLKGNHEQALLEFLDDPPSGLMWAQHGGTNTLLSYGVYPPASRLRPESWDETRNAFSAALPPNHLAFFQSLDLSFSLGDYMFVHAGVRPGVGLAEQSEHDMLWIRDEFLKEKRPFDKIIVHGHTPADQPFIGPGRIGLDTGAYATGVLSAVRLSDGDPALLSAEL